MAHYAELDENNIVVKVHYVDNEHLTDEHGFCHDEKGFDQCVKACCHERFVQTSMNGNIRAKWAKIGDFYDSDLDIFYDPIKPFLSWDLDTQIGAWVAPIPKPDEEETDFEWLWLENVYQTTGEGWFKYPLLSPMLIMLGNFVEWNGQNNSFDVIISPLTEDLLKEGYRCEYNDQTKEFTLIPPGPKPGPDVPDPYEFELSLNNLNVNME